ncbi:MAG: RNA polymerase sigma-70 factor [Bacteroidales bacterium]
MPENRFDKSPLILPDHFEEIYLKYYAGMCRFAEEYIGSQEEAKNLTQDIFMILWSKKDDLIIQNCVSTYLYSLLQNRCLDFLKHQRVVQKYNMEMEIKIEALQEINLDFTSDQELEQLIENAINRLPERCRQIFLLSRVENKKYREISQLLNISENTVETQMKIALKKLRAELKEYFPLVFFML